MNFDCIFIDTTCPNPYDKLTLDTEPTGGTEATVVMVAEQLASLGLAIAVLQHNRDRESKPAYAYYLPLSYISKVKVWTVVSLRGINALNLFPRATKYAWMHDLATGKLSDWVKTLLDLKITMLGVSKWHKHQLQYYVCDPERLENPKVDYIYNPIPDTLYLPKKTQLEYNPNKLLWASAPHKGLKEAIDLFRRLREVSGNDDWQLQVYNPGYSEGLETNVRGVMVGGSVTRAELHQQMASSLGLFYPTTYQETFGLVAAEANAVGCPVLTNGRAGLLETAHPRPLESGRSIIDTAIAWQKHGRPVVYGNPKFKLSEVTLQWTKLILR